MEMHVLKKDKSKLIKTYEKNIHIYQKKKVSKNKD